jgi:hypothetical protein
MADANCSPAVASIRAKYVDDIRVQILLGALPRSHKLFLAADAQHFPDRCSRLHPAVPEGRLAVTARSATDPINFVLAKQRFLLNPPLVRDFCSKLRAPHWGKSLGPFVCGAKKILSGISVTGIKNVCSSVCAVFALEVCWVESSSTITSPKFGVDFNHTTIRTPLQ